MGWERWKTDRSYAGKEYWKVVEVVVELTDESCRMIPRYLYSENE